ncbi:MAG: translation initiation factor IF-6 [Candidatus Micrarchaeia archaeon]
MLRTSYYGNSFIGLFFRANDSVLLAPLDAPDKVVDALENELKVRAVRVSMANSNLVGIYTAMNNNGIVLPNVIEESERLELKKEGLNVFVSRELNNAHGNNLCVNDKRGIVNPRVDSAERKKMEDALGVEMAPVSLAGHTTVGSACASSADGFLAHYAIAEKELQEVEEALKVPGDKGTVNGGAGFVGLGVVHNKNGFAVGESTTGFEMGKVAGALGYVK